MRDRLTLPLLLPALTVGAILLTIFSFGHLLLRVFESSAIASRIIAIGAATTILLVASILANRPALKSGWWVYPATALPTAIILASGLFYFIRPAEEGAGGGTTAAIAAPGPLVETATDNKFSATAFTIVAGAQYTLDFTNQGNALHNWRLKGVAGADGKDVQTQIIGGGKSESVSFTVPQPGTYDFVCDVHPTEMMGKLTVVAEGASTAAAAGQGTTAGGANPGPSQIIEIATDNKFAATQLSAYANTPTPLTLQNKGSAIHNIRLQVKDIDGKEPQTALLPGGQSQTIQFTVAVPGTYDFICDVHPNEMKGKITIQ